MVHSRRVTVARARPLTSSSLAKDSMSARRTANKFREWTRHQVVNWRMSSAYASRVSPRYPARNPARASRSGLVKAGWIVARAVDGAAVVIGHLPGRPGPERLGHLQVPAVERKPNLSGAVSHAMSQPAAGQSQATYQSSAPDRRIGAPETCADRADSHAQIYRFWAWSATRSMSLGGPHAGGVAASAAFSRGTNGITVGKDAAMARVSERAGAAVLLPSREMSPPLSICRSGAGCGGWPSRGW